MRPSSIAHLRWILVCAVGCSGSPGATDASDTTTTKPPLGTVTAPPAVSETTIPQVATVATPFAYDATCAGKAFTDPKGGGLSYRVTFTPNANGLSATNGRVGGVPSGPGVVTARITAVDVKGDSASQEFVIVAFAAGLPSPTLPATAFAYSDATAPLPPHFRGPGGPGASVLAADNMPATNPTTDAGAALGRVLFYDVRLSANDRVACASCHIQAFGFSDTARFSKGFNGGRTARHAMALANARFYARGRFFWDERAATLEDQVLQPIQNDVEMGLTLAQLETKVRLTSYYPALFRAAFGSADITSDRISRALAQFVRSIISAGSKFDGAFASLPPDFGVLTAQEQEGRLVFNGSTCGQCHDTNALISDDIHNTGLDATITDAGAGGGRFKAPSLRNVGVRAPYMHDGRFESLQRVVDFYDHEVQANPNLDRRLRGPNGNPRRLNLTRAERDALVAFLNTFTDPAFLTAPKFANPFR
jgi:cytochrome c peroxidase